MCERRTEAGEWLAVWRLDHWRIRVLLVCGRTDLSRPLLTYTPASAPDLADARERFPGLAVLWNAIRHEYWAEVVTPQEHSQGTI
ncbi:hypothetical protein [Nocardia blacklockiae]|uniref:hypothetical protein n=1 Tax=Nocardia blacklockiae TaxID=480036 RepID=UPI001894973F|nr:hypothetical protein [Nocardia blacklockiae]MBF6176186.1 hypothetical protein [Nocardia blacklockiae]